VSRVPIYKATARLSSAQHYALPCIVRENRTPPGYRQSIARLQHLGRVEFADVHFKDGTVGGEYRGTITGTERV
jgi:hypothetical protein